MSDDFNCPKCQTPMQHGFVFDRGDYNMPLGPRWVAGDEKTSIWTGAATRQQVKDALPVITLRCPTCGYLESYAPPLRPE